MVITRAHNETLFVNSGFWTVAKTEQLVLLENQPDGPARFTAPMVMPGDEALHVGAIVMNCNPFTLGHRYLVEYAAAQCDVLHLFVVEEDRSMFSSQVRLRLVREGTAHLPNVRVHPSGHYMISSATFPTYFLKQEEDATAMQCALDCTVFAQCIAPPLHIRTRFVGQEPLDPVTAQYNAAMAALLPRHGGPGTGNSPPGSGRPAGQRQSGAAAFKGKGPVPGSTLPGAPHHGGLFTGIFCPGVIRHGSGDNVSGDGLHAGAGAAKPHGPGRTASRPC